MKVNMVLSSYPDEVSESVVDVGTTWHEKATAWTQVVEEEQLLVLWNRQKERETILCVRKSVWSLQNVIKTQGF